MRQLFLQDLSFFLQLLLPFKFFLLSLLLQHQLLVDIAISLSSRELSVDHALIPTGLSIRSDFMILFDLFLFVKLFHLNDRGLVVGDRTAHIAAIVEIASFFVLVELFFEQF